MCMKVREWFSIFLSPIVTNFPVFFMTFMLWSVETVRNLHGRMVTYDPTVTFFDLFCRFTIIFLFAYLFAALATIINRVWLKILIYLFVIFVFSFYLFLRIVFDLSINPHIFVLLAETNQNESREFINSFFLSPSGITTFSIVVTVIIIAFLVEIFYNKDYLLPIKQKIKNNTIFLMVSVIILLFGVVSSRTYFDLFARKTTDEVGWWNGSNKTPKDPLSLIAYSFHGIHILNEEQKTFENLMQRIDKNVSCSINDSLNLVLVIGESFIKSHTPLYGYPLNTTPNLIQERNSRNLFVFNDVISPFAATSTTIKNILCTNSISDGESWNLCYYFPAIFSIAGYDVYFWDNQKDMSPDANFSFALNSFLYNNVAAESYTAVNEKSYEYDESLVCSFDAVNLKNEHNLIIFHLMGQHVDPAVRFPHTKDFLTFTKDSIIRNEKYMTDDKRQSIADYDNATFYNDYVMSEIFNRFRNSNTVLVYFSDHGEEVYDYRDSRGRVNDNMSKNQVKYQFEIPFMIWCSEAFKEKFPEKLEMIKTSLNRPFMTDNLCQMMFALGGVKCTYYHKERDLLSPYFKPRKRLINGNCDYDQIIKTKSS